MKVFLSYSRDSLSVVQKLVEDLTALGHHVWLDQELSGGHEWWSVILEQLRQCDVLVAVISPRALASGACRRETSYASDLGKAVLPVFVSADVSSTVLTPALSKIQYVDYSIPESRTAVLKLARALGALPARAPLPHPLPTPPDAPVSRLTELRQQLDSTADLTFAEQSALFLELTQTLRDPEQAGRARSLVELLAARPDLRLQIADEIKRVLAGPSDVADPATSPSSLRDGRGAARAAGSWRRWLVAGGIAVALLLSAWLAANLRQTVGGTIAADGSPGAGRDGASAPDDRPSANVPPPAAEPSAEDLNVATAEYARAVAAHRAESLQEAETYLTRAIARNPKHLEALRLRCEIRVELDKPGGADDCAAAIALKDDAPNIDYFFFQAARGREPDKACQALSRALDMDPQYGLAYFGRGLCAQYKFQWEDALRDYKDALRYDPALWKANYGAAFALYHLRRYSDAELEATKAIAGSKGMAATYELRGFIRANRNDKITARVDFNAAIRRAKGDDSYARSLSYLENGPDNYLQKPRNEPEP